MNTAFLLEQTAQQTPYAPAIYSGTELFVNYLELINRAKSIAYSLKQRGLKPGNHVAVCSVNCPEYLEILYGIWAAGMVAVPINAKLHPQEISYILRNSESKVFYVSKEIADLFHQSNLIDENSIWFIEINSETYEKDLGSPLNEIEHRSPSDLAWIFYTSGTTGKPKGVMLTHNNILSMTYAYFSNVDTIESTNSSVYAAPMSHGAGFYSIPHVLKGAKHVIPKSGGFEPFELADLAISHKEVSMFAAPTMIKRLIHYLKSSSSQADIAQAFKTIVYGGGPMYTSDLQDALTIMGNRFVQIYGQGESPMTITSLSKEIIAHSAHPNWNKRIASVGQAQSIVEVRIADESGNVLPMGSVGEVIVRGPTVMSGYWNNPDATNETIQNGWLFTGDMGSLDDEGFLTLKDRSKDLIISGGSNIYPREVEEVLLQHPEISEVSVIGVPDLEWGEIVLAFVVQHPNASMPINLLESQLDELCLRQIARFKRPKKYILLDALPKNNYGKILKTELRLLAREMSENGL